MWLAQELSTVYSCIVLSCFFCRFLPTWLKFFTINETLLVVDHHRFTHDLYNELRRIESFLELPHKISPDSVMKNKNNMFCKQDTRKGSKLPMWCMGANKGRNHTRIPPHIYRILKTYFRDNNVRFFHDIGEDLGWNDYFHLDKSTQMNTSNVN